MIPTSAEDRYLEHFQDGRLRDCSSKEAFLLGYHQAEKDLELSWEDIKLVHNITYDESRNVALNKGGEISEQEFYQEVLKRFNDFKEKKQQ